MIQRIQSLWLLLATVMMLLVFKFPFASVKTREIPIERYAYNSLQLFILGIILALGSFVVIFLFKRRSKQKRIIWLGILTCILYLVFMFFEAQGLNSMPDNTNAMGYEMKYEIGSIFPVFYIILMAMAYAGVWKDEKLIRSQRRLRQ